MTTILSNHMSREELIAFLERSYVHEKKSSLKIAEEFLQMFGVKYSASVFVSALHELGIPVRTISEAKAKIYYSAESPMLSDARVIQVIDGLLLSDASLGAINGRARLHQQSTCREFLEFVYPLLIGYAPNEITYVGISHKARKETFGFTTSAHPDFDAQFLRWYPHGQKIVPKDVVLTPLSMKIWYYGDGSLVKIEKSNAIRLRLSTDGFPFEDVEFLVSKLKEEFGLETKRTSDNRIVVASDSVPDFFDIIGRKSDFPGYAYKFDLEPWRYMIHMKDAAERLGIPYSRLNHLVQIGSVPCKRSPGGKKVVFDEDQFAAMVSMKVSGMLTADARFVKTSAAAGRCGERAKEHRVDISAMLPRAEEWKKTTFKMSEGEIVSDFNRLRNVPVIAADGNFWDANTRESRLCVHFHPHMMRTRSGGKKTVAEALDDGGIVKDVVTEMVLKKMEPDYRTFMNLVLRHDSVRRASVFPVRLAKTILNAYGVPGSRVLDPCAGWSSRLIGFYASDLHDSEYVGIEPQPETVEGLQRTITEIGPMAPRRKASIVPGPAEEIMSTLPDASFDMVFTSPPYFDLEKYGDHPGQSFLRFPKYEDWLDGFLFKVMVESRRVLKAGGCLLLNVSNCKEHKLAEHAELYGRKLFDLEKVMFLRFPHHWQANYLEPLLVFRKP